MEIIIVINIITIHIYTCDYFGGLLENQIPIQKDHLSEAAANQ